MGKRTGTFLMHKRKLIEVALPLEAINRESAREKSLRHGHPSTLHLWWARRPLAAARAVLFAQLVDDPSSHPEKFPTEEAQKTERQRLHKLIEDLVKWENIHDEKLFAEAHEEILNSTGGNPPPILDPFCGGGTIPLEAQRLGLHAHASDLNPVAVLITKALIEIPPKFRDQPPVFPGLADTRTHWKGSEGLAADVRAYGQWMRDEAEKRIGHLYPKAKLPDGSEATVIAWIWARTVTCPNPACGIEMPLVRTWWLGKKKGKEAYIVPTVVADPLHPGGRRVEFTIGNGSGGTPPKQREGTVQRDGGVCIACGTRVPFEYIRAEGRSQRLNQNLLAVVTEGIRQRIYLAPTPQQRQAAKMIHDGGCELGLLPDQALGFRVQAYGMTEWAQLFSDRQRTALTTLSALVGEVRTQVNSDIDSMRSRSTRRESGDPRGDAIATYLALAISRMTDYQSTLAFWSNDPKNEVIVHVFGRQTLSMTWDFAEGNPLHTASGSFGIMVKAIASALGGLGFGESAVVSQDDARTALRKGVVISTDPPYYDNIAYADLSDYFYVWLRMSLRDVYPNLFSTVLTPKSEELIANPFRGGAHASRVYFEQGFENVFANARNNVREDYPMTIFYAFKQSESTSDGIVSSGWETLLDGMVKSGWSITGTWPLRTESSGRLRATGSNALASSIGLVLRGRSEDAATVDRRGFIASLQAELPQALRELQQGMIAPVDLPQAAIGPGMAVFSRYSSVIEPDGDPMTVRSALARINEILDQVLNEQEGDFDSTTRFAIAWYRQYGFGTGTFGDADNLARARNTAVDTLDRNGVLTSRAGKVALIKPADLPANYDVAADEHTSIWEATHHLIRVLESDGIGRAGALLASTRSRADGAINTDLVKELAFLMFSLAEKGKRSQDALSYNALATSWSEILDASRSVLTTADQDQLPYHTTAE
jgi:putative DNA methylase